jgi:hypothetical protein
MTISTINGFNKAFPDEIKRNIFINLEDSELQKCTRVCKDWQKLVTDEYFLNSRPDPEPAKVFGGNKWREYFGDPGKVPRLRLIEKILQEPCPIYKGKKIKETHFLFFRPETLDGNPLTLFKIGELFPLDEQENGFQSFELEEIKNTPFEKGEWILMTKKVLPSSGDINYSEQLMLIEKLSKKARVKYYPLTLQDAVTGMFLYELISDERLYTPLIYTSCQKEGNQKLSPAVTVSFGPKGINVRYLNKPDPACGIGAMRKIQGK